MIHKINFKIVSFFIALMALSSKGFAENAPPPKKPKATGSTSSTSGTGRVISHEGRSKAGSKTKIDFDDADIGGAAKTPYGTMLSNTKANKNYDMVPIRTDWRPEMLQSATSLDAGRAK